LQYKILALIPLVNRLSKSLQEGRNKMCGESDVATLWERRRSALAFAVRERALKRFGVLDKLGNLRIPGAATQALGPTGEESRRLLALRTEGVETVEAIEEGIGSSRRLGFGAGQQRGVVASPVSCA
jgi:hypothetical protein